MKNHCENFFKKLHLSLIIMKTLINEKPAYKLTRRPRPVTSVRGVGEG